MALEKDPSGKSQHEPGAKMDSGKTLPWLCISGFANALEKVAEVTTIGATKYSPNGWAKVENGSERYMEAAGRHLLALAKGEVFDDGVGGTGCMHKAQVIWGLLASLELDLRTVKEIKYESPIFTSSPKATEVSYSKEESAAFWSPVPCPRVWPV